MRPDLVDGIQVWKATNQQMYGSGLITIHLEPTHPMTPTIILKKMRLDSTRAKCRGSTPSNVVNAPSTIDGNICLIAEALLVAGLPLASRNECAICAEKSTATPTAIMVQIVVTLCMFKRTAKVIKLK